MYVNGIALILNAKVLRLELVQEERQHKEEKRQHKEEERQHKEEVTAWQGKLEESQKKLEDSYDAMHALNLKLLETMEARTDYRLQSEMYQWWYALQVLRTLMMESADNARGLFGELQANLGPDNQRLSARYATPEKITQRFSLPFTFPASLASI